MFTIGKLTFYALGYTAAVGPQLLVAFVIHPALRQTKIVYYTAFPYLSHT